jgi:hypothetical protein
LSITFYLPEDEEIKTKKESMKDIIVIKKVDEEKKSKNH